LWYPILDTFKTTTKPGSDAKYQYNSAPKSIVYHDIDKTPDWLNDNNGFDPEFFRYGRLVKNRRQSVTVRLQQKVCSTATTAETTNAASATRRRRLLPAVDRWRSSGVHSRTWPHTGGAVGCRF
jgi:hypothetical protein